jgi:hypothetical protein
MNQKINPQVVVKLKEALCRIYWYKKDLRLFLESAMSDKTRPIIATLNWEQQKYYIASDFVDRLIKRQDIYQQDLINIIKHVCDFNDFSHFNIIADAKKMIDEANTAVEGLRKMSIGYFKEEEKQQQIQVNKIKSQDLQTKNIDYSKRLTELEKEYRNLIKIENRQKRGYEFEKFINELFLFFDIDVKKSFKYENEQIDGAFTHDNRDYLCEVKWTSVLTTQAEVDVLYTKVSRKLNATLGLFISYYGFGDFEKTTKNYPTIILMDGQEIMTVLEGRVNLNDVLKRKRQEASRTGDIYYKLTL